MNLLTHMQSSIEIVLFKYQQEAAVCFIIVSFTIFRAFHFLDFLSRIFWQAT